VGIIGVGRIAVDAHIGACRQAGGELVALADVAPGRARRFADQFGVPRAFDDYRQLLALPEIEVVAICSPIFAHEENAVAAFAAGKHVLMEKPPAMNEAQMQRITAAGHQAGKLLLVGSQSVYLSPLQELRRRIAAGELGRVYLAHVRACERRGTPHGWLRQKQFAGGGAGMDGNSHVLDRLLFLLGSPTPVTVTARIYNEFATQVSTSPYKDMDTTEGRSEDAAVKDVEDTAVYLVQFREGMTALVEVSKTAHLPNFGGEWIYGSRGGATLNPPRVYADGPDGKDADTDLPVGPKENGHAKMYAHLFDCIREGRPATQSPGERACLIMRIIDALYASAEQNGKQINLGKDL
jgi:predicted dehydrogenase